jgi:hypothetical protein
VSDDTQIEQNHLGWLAGGFIGQSHKNAIFVIMHKAL